MANNVDPDEMAHYEPSHLDLHCLQQYPYWSLGMKGLELIELTLRGSLRLESSCFFFSRVV